MYKYLLGVFLLFLSQTIFADDGQKVWRMVETSDQKYFVASLMCDTEPTVGSFQNCWLDILRSNKPLTNAKVFIKGGMPAHQHGLPTAPQIKWSEDKKAYIIKGLKFSMPGEWVLKFLITDDSVNTKHESKDQVSFNFEIK